MYPPIPTKRPTPSEYAVIVVFIAVLFIVLGVLGFVVALRAPAEKHELAVQLMRYSAWSLGSGVLVGFIYWLYRRLT